MFRRARQACVARQAFNTIREFTSSCYIHLFPEVPHAIQSPRPLRSSVQTLWYVARATRGAVGYTKGRKCTPALSVCVRYLLVWACDHKKNVELFRLIARNNNTLLCDKRVLSTLRTASTYPPLPPTTICLRPQTKQSCWHSPRRRLTHLD